MSRINRINRVGEKASSIPFKKQSYCGHQKYINICTFVIFKKKGTKTSLAPCGWSLKNEVIWKAIGAHVTKSHIKQCDTHTHTSTNMAVHMWASDERAEPLEP